MQMRNPQYSTIEQAYELDSHPEVSLDFAHVRRSLEQGYDKPFLIIDLDIVRQKARRFKAAMPRVQQHFAVKSNPTPDVLRALKEEGVGFEIASIAELDLLLSLGVEAKDIYYSNPMKSRRFVEYAAAKGVEWYVIDSVEELQKVVSIKADAKLYVRIDAPNVGSDWPLSGKFGAFPEEVREIIDEAVNLKADLAGVTFHVGSQCRNPENWRLGIERAKRVFTQMRQVGLNPRLLNLGGGYPVRHVKPIPAIEIIGQVINDAIADLPEDIRIMAEPGRYLVSDAGYFVCRVVGTASRAGKRWMYWDAGVFGGVIEPNDDLNHGGLHYRIHTDKTGEIINWTVAGPTCDSVDIVMRDVEFPNDLKEGDFIYISNAGAYTTAYASEFNGFPLPGVIVLNK